LVAEEASLQAVEVQAEPVAERQRQIAVNSNSPSRKQVWQVLTDYEALVTLSPTLPKSSAGASNRSIRLGAGTQRLLRFNFRACDSRLRGKFPHEINFNMVEGIWSLFWHLAARTLHSLTKWELSSAIVCAFG